jgi:hypothetical protein
MAPHFELAHHGGFDTMITVLNSGRILLALLLRRKADREQELPAGAGENTNPDGRI